MGKAKREGGLYYTPQGVAVDAEGRKVEDAPKLPADTDPSKQPGALGAGSPAAMVMRLDEDSIRALGGKPAKEPKESKSASRGADEEQQRDNVNAPPDPGNRTPTETAPTVTSQQPGEGGTEPSTSARKGGGRKGGARKGGARKGGARKSAGNK
jgi:hypothetical protein